MDAVTARHKAHELFSITKKHGVSPKAVAARIEACELTLGQVWDTYINALRSLRRRPRLPNGSRGYGPVGDCGSGLPPCSGDRLRRPCPFNLMR